MPSSKYRGILFLCTGNSCRSQMAEGFARLAVPAGVQVWSAGTAPVELNPFAVRVMQEAGVDISGHRAKGLGEVPLYLIDLVVTVCATADGQCPIPPGKAPRIHWPIDDPAKAKGGDEEVLAAFRRVRDDVRQRVEDLVEGLL